MNGWEITTISANGTGSSQATAITRNSPWMIVNAITDNATPNFAVKLPSSPSIGDSVDVCVGSTFAQATVWLGIVSSNNSFDTVNTGRRRSYRYIDGPAWNVLSS